MRVFDYSKKWEKALMPEIVALLTQIHEFKGKQEQYLDVKPDVLSQLIEVAKIQSTEASNKIEGIRTTDERLNALMKDKTMTKNRNECEIAGYRDALNIIHEGHDHLSVNEELLLRLHTVLLSHTGTEYGGEYKTEDNAVYEKFSDGSIRIRWNPVTAKDTPAAMQQLFYAYSSARNDAGIDQLLLIPCFILDFLCIHPFQDGNGRMSRLLSLLLLYKNNFDISKYISFEEQINQMKGEYYDALQRSSFGWHENSNDYIPFIENFLMSLYMCYKELDKRFLTLGSQKANKKERVESAIMNAFLPISKKEICQLFPDISESTVETVVASLLKEGRIRKVGTTRGARYIKT